MAEIKVYVDKAFVATGENVIGEDYMVSYPLAKGTLVLSGVAQGDPYARQLEVYADGVLKYQNAVINSFNTQVNLGNLTQGRHTVGVKIPTSVGSWTVNGAVVLDTIETPDIVPFETTQEWTEPPLEPSRTITGPATIAPPASDVPVQDAPMVSGLWEQLTKPSLRLFPTQEEIDAQNREIARIKVAAENIIPQVTHLDLIAPTPDFAESSSIPLAVQAASDRLKEIPTGNLPQFDFPSGTLGSPEYGPTELSYLASSFHKDNFGRDVFTVGGFSAETNMILLGAGVAALVAAAAYTQRDKLAKIIKR